MGTDLYTHYKEQGSNNAYMEDWIGEADEPKTVSSFMGDHTKYYNLRLQIKDPIKTKDIVHSMKKMLRDY